MVALLEGAALKAKLKKSTCCNVVSDVQVISSFAVSSVAAERNVKS